MTKGSQINKKKEMSQYNTEMKEKILHSYRCYKKKTRHEKLGNMKDGFEETNPN